MRHLHVSVVLAAAVAVAAASPAGAQPPVPVPPLPGVELPPLPPPQFPPEPAPQPAPDPDDPDVAPSPAPDDTVEALNAQLDQANAELAEAERSTQLPDEWPDLTAVDLLPSIRDVVPFADRPVPVLLDVFQVTLFKLPPGEAVVDIVIGDPLFFETSGEGSEVFVKPMRVPRRTSLLLTTRDGADYSFDLFATAAYVPDVQLRLRTVLPQPEPPPRRRPAFDLRFGTLSDLQARRAEIAALRDQIARVDADATRQVADVDALRVSRLTAVRRAYAESIEQRYWLSQDLVDPPLSVSQIWTDGQFTFLRSTAQEAPALYALSPQNPDESILVNYELTPDGLYIVDHVMSAGWAQVGDVRGDWRLWDSPTLDRLDDLELPVYTEPRDGDRTDGQYQELMTIFEGIDLEQGGDATLPQLEAVRTEAPIAGVRIEAQLAEMRVREVEERNRARILNAQMYALQRARRLSSLAVSAHSAGPRVSYRYVTLLQTVPSSLTGSV